jgi:predicted O-methyltransferase YrrM
MSIIKAILRPAVHVVKVVGLSTKLKRGAARSQTTRDLVEVGMHCEFLGFSVAPMQMEDELLRFVEFVRERAPKRVLEIGTARGGSLFLLCQVCPEDGLLISADLPEGEFGGGYPRWKVPLYRRFARGRQDLRLIRGDSHAPETLDKVKAALGGGQLDLLFIDGDHSYAGVSRDFADYSPLVKDGGVIAMHDVVPGPEENVGGAPDFWNEIAGRFGGYVIKSDMSRGCYGIGVIPDWKQGSYFPEV